MTTTRRTGFTIVELLVVIGVLAILMGLLLPALVGVKRRGKKAEEINGIRQVGVAWSLYAQSNEDSALPGFLDADPGPGGESVQEAWRVAGRYEFPDGSEIPAAECEAWTWRLLPYLDFDEDTVVGYLGLARQSEFARREMGDYGIEDTLIDGTITARPVTIARHPAFGYNAFYVGGWWDQWLEDGSRPRPRPRFHRARKVTDEDPSEWKPIGVVARSPSSIESPARMLLFCSTAAYPPGEYHGASDVWPGAHFGIPPYLAQREIWRKASASDMQIAVLDRVPGTGNPLLDAPIPIGRHTDQVAVLHADLHSEPRSPGDLDDQQFWVNGADTRLFQHSED